MIRWYFELCSQLFKGILSLTCTLPCTLRGLKITRYIDAAENKESLEPEDRRQRPRAGLMELSPTGTEWNMCGFAYSNPDRNVYLWSCAGGDSIPLIVIEDGLEKDVKLNIPRKMRYDIIPTIMHCLCTSSGKPSLV